MKSEVILACLAALSGAGCLPNPSLNEVCDEIGCSFSHDEWRRLQRLTNLGPPPQDLSNFVDGMQPAIALGRAFFNDPRFSGPASQVDALRRPAAVARAPLGQPTNLSCASCHDLTRAGADTASVPGNVSSGAGWSDVNALAIVNAAYQRLFTWNGRADSLWSQAFAVAENPTTMNGNRLRTFHVIVDDDNYRAAYNSIFNDDLPQLSPQDPRFPPDGKPGKDGCQAGDATEPFGDALDCMALADQELVKRVLINWAKALAAYEATLTSRHAAFDVFMQEGPGSSAVGAAAKRGARLFVSKAGCIDCHNTPLLSDGDFHNVGVLQVGPDVPTEADCPSGGACDCVTPPAGKGCLPWGALDGLTKLRASKTLRSSVYSDNIGDTSRADELARPLTSALQGAWRTPTLRNVALTAPYMHDGIYETLEQVVAHYNRGGDSGAPGVRAVQIRPLGLTDGEQVDLVAFLQTLTEIEGGTGFDPGSTGSGGAIAATPRSCQTPGNGLTNCGEHREDCCTSLPVAGGGFYRTYTNDGTGPTAEADPATVSSFRLDKYDVTVGRFRQFVAAWDNGRGWTPPVASGKHAYLNGGQGLSNSASPGTFESGWLASDNTNIAPTNANLSCGQQSTTWTSTPSTNETLPIGCVNWYEAYAFCIWDGGFLPSEAELEYAAAGGDQQRAYPWGSTAPGTACPGTGCEYAIYGCLYPSGPTPNCQTPLHAASVGTASLGAGRFGQLDLAGGTWEIVLDGYSSYVNPCVDCAYSSSGATATYVIHGGSFDGPPEWLTPPFRGHPVPQRADLGFRCARSPSP